MLRFKAGAKPVQADHKLVKLILAKGIFDGGVFALRYLPDSCEQGFALWRQPDHPLPSVAGRHMLNQPQISQVACNTCQRRRQNDQNTCRARGTAVGRYTESSSYFLLHNANCNFTALFI